jgi:hypothetical protein
MIAKRFALNDVGNSPDSRLRRHAAVAVSPRSVEGDRAASLREGPTE